MRNVVQLIGNLGRNIDFQQLDSGKERAKFSLATNEYYKDSKGERVVETQWHNVVAWGKTAKLMAESLSKGEQVLLRGKLTQRKYEGEDGQTKYFHEVVAREFLKLSRLSDDKIPF